ncbi:hypothetical protein KQY30_06900 [Streptomyces sp. GMY02]|uniref:hypothetical protein n=1 Tax=Streptomyces sp. GMY02 TaxID=1333528 RepID=UPI001C2C074A|nr:hypothetical protein [Streptomyces sp. GMY02]QXE34060.1 hypothetical protein KQY30_06900 [Streptomyces sp. GMY02]
MDLVQVFADLDAQPWADLQHAYGSAADVPGLLRGLASEDEEEGSAALDELYGSIFHQGSVYDATARAVPYLARLAAAGVRSPDLLVLLGGIAEGEHERGPSESEPGACRAAVIAQLPLILPFVEDGDARLRQAAVWTAAGTGEARTVLPVLLRRREREKDALVRAELLSGIVLLDPVGSAPGVVAALDPGEPPELRIAAVLASLDTGLPWTPAHHETAVSLLPLDDLVADRFDQDRTEPLQYIVAELLERDTSADREAALFLLDAALRAPGAESRAEGLWAAEQACDFSRSAPARLASAVIGLLGDPSSARTALLVLDKLGPHAAPAAPALAALAAGGGDLADRALSSLVRVDPERAAPLLARDLPERPGALGAAVGFPDGRDAPSFPYHPELLTAVRVRLADPELQGNEPIHLTRLLTHWGERAAPAFPELVAALRRFPLVVPRALAAVDPAGAVAPLREAAVSGPDEGRFAAARALHGLTGESEPLLTALAAELAGGDLHRIREAVGAVDALGQDATVLLPVLRAALGGEGDRRTTPRMDADLETALALWRLTGDPDDAVPVIAGVLADADNEWARWTAIRAARAAARLGPAAAALVPALEHHLTDLHRAPSVALALLAVAPSTQDPADLAATLLAAAERNADPQGALDALTALGPAALTPDHRARLRDLAERDRRVWPTGHTRSLIAADAHFQQQARALLAVS